MRRVPGGMTPFKELLDLQERLQRLLGRSMDDPAYADPEDVRGVYEPPCDLYETEAGYIVELELPGVDPAAVHLTVEGDTLVVRGEREAHPLKGASHVQLERPIGAFGRRITLPGAIDPETVAARYDAGVLIVTAPRKQEGKKRRIRVKKG